MHRGPYEATFESLQQFRCPDWFRNAKLGIWSHWGAQSVPRQGDWYARNMYIPGTHAYRHHWRNYGHPSKSGYKDIVTRWKAERFDPDALADLYARAGARYLVAQAVHHDHFLNYPSAIHRWNAGAMGPRKDIVGLWHDAARARGLRFGITEHLGATYTWMARSKGADATGPYAGLPYDGNDPEFEDLYLPGPVGRDRSSGAAVQEPWYAPDPWWHRRWLDLVTEMVDRYRPDLLYSDGPLPFGAGAFEPGLQAVSHLYNTSAAGHDGENQAVYNQKGRGPDLEAIGVLDIERSQEPDARPFVWQTDTCVGQWFYDDRAEYKTPGHVIELLIDIVAKNGNLLLNIPQLPDGSIDEECTFLLEELAGWIAACGEGIHGTRPFRTCGEGPSQVAIEGFREDAVDWTAEDFRFTQRDQTLYAFQMRWPADGRAVIKSLGPDERVSAVRLLGAGELAFEQNTEQVTITLPAKPPTRYPHCLALQL
ncbi:alpha-L-fucosidase [Pseudonocardia cypriaca]|uniref:alpha-L-fucosidase n=1 Tax=Pseudonocardia cypriaca TaxID=882449 RepID=A0A543GBY1_9PSEU|nr:alpha-L-fucosidase [Pseudonocardia cypriaca]TQM43595.1 alpha-L-fucosidase [Pseudonocardia cypriaca]